MSTLPVSKGIQDLFDRQDRARKILRDRAIAAEASEILDLPEPWTPPTRVTGKTNLQQEEQMYYWEVYKRYLGMFQDRRLMMRDKSVEFSPDVVMLRHVQLLKDAWGTPSDYRCQCCANIFINEREGGVCICGAAMWEHWVWASSSTQVKRAMMTPEKMSKYKAEKMSACAARNFQLFLQGKPEERLKVSQAFMADADAANASNASMADAEQMVASMSSASSS